jgi:radical SAM-linked protein
VRPRADQTAARIRLRFAKDGAMRYLSHLELLTVFTRAVSRGGVPILFSQGFHPHPRFSFATATSVGVESLAEYMDMFVADGLPAEEIQQRLNSALPEGLRILEAEQIEVKSPSLSTLIDRTRYRITFGDDWSGRLDDLCRNFMAAEEFVIQRKKKGEIQTVDLRSEASSLAASGSTLELVARRGKPLEFARAITGDQSIQGDDVRVEKLEVIFTE